MGIKEELHDIKVMGGLRNYLVTLVQIKRSNREWRRAQEARERGELVDVRERVPLAQRWSGWRDASVKARAERKERRLMKTSTWDALVETYDEDERDPYTWPQAELEATIADTIAVERRRWLERGVWITLAITTAGLGWLAGWYMQPQFQPQPWDCTVKVAPEATLVEPTIMRCVGGEMP